VKQRNPGMLPREESAKQEESTEEPMDQDHKIRKSTIEHELVPLPSG